MPHLPLVVRGVLLALALVLFWFAWGLVGPAGFEWFMNSGRLGAQGGMRLLGGLGLFALGFVVGVLALGRRRPC